MNDETVKVYAAQADKKERDPYGPDGSERAVVVNGRGFNLYKRFNPGAEYVMVAAIDGRMVELTRKQADVLDLARTYIDNGHTTMRAMAEELKVSPSTVYRALVRLAAFGLIGYITARGWHHGTLFFSRGRNDGMERFQKAAKETIRKWAKATEARFSRLRDSVASYYSMREIGGRGRVTDFYSTSTPMVATLTRPWTPEDLREAEII